MSNSETTGVHISSLKRDLAERNLTFLGFFILENALKQESKKVIKELTEANVRSVIITGDNAMTAIHVSRKLEICSNIVLVDKFEEQVLFGLLNRLKKQKLK